MELELIKKTLCLMRILQLKLAIYVRQRDSCAKCFIVCSDAITSTHRDFSEPIVLYNNDVAMR